MHLLSALWELYCTVPGKTHAGNSRGRNSSAEHKIMRYAATRIMHLNSVPASGKRPTILFFISCNAAGLFSKSYVLGSTHFRQLWRGKTQARIPAPGLSPPWLQVWPLLMLCRPLWCFSCLVLRSAAGCLLLAQERVLPIAWELAATQRGKPVPWLVVSKCPLPLGSLQGGEDPGQDPRS